MMVSEFIALVGRLLSMHFDVLIFITIAAVIAGALAHKLATDIESPVTLASSGLVVLLFWIHFWEIGEIFWGTLFTVSLAVVGHEAYRRLAERQL